MKIGPELVKAIQPFAGLLNQCLDVHSHFYQFLAANPQHTDFLKKLTAQMQLALRFKKYGNFINKHGVSKDLFAEYLEAIQELNAGKPNRLIDLFEEPIAKNIVKVFNANLASLTALNKEFLAFELSLATPAIKLDESFDEVPVIDPMSQSMISHFDAKVGLVDHLNQVDDLIDSRTGKRFADIALDQSFYIGSTSKSSTPRAGASLISDLIDSRTGKRFVDLALDQSFYAGSTSKDSTDEDDFGFVMIDSERSKAPAITPGYKLVGKYGQDVSGHDLSQSIRMVPDSNHNSTADSSSLLRSVKSIFGY